jgi:hypothetical protein
MRIRKLHGMRASEFLWRRRKRKVTPGTRGMDPYLRRAAYYRQNGSERLTPRQRRRVEHKANAGRSGD